MARESVPKKLYYKIGEACRAIDVQPYVLRYWETEFPFLSPDKSRSGQRVYTSEELDIIRRIKELLYEEGYTIAGAKKKLEAELDSGGPRLAQRNGGGDEEEENGAVETDDDDGRPLDSSAAERIEQLEAGLQKALEEARAILSLLDDR
jgi:DNA-binding transcriptional MerR regulator